MDKFRLQAQKYVKSVRKSIIRDYDEVPEEWEAQLQQLEDLYSHYLNAQDYLNGCESLITSINDGKTACTDPHFNIIIQCIKSMDKILKTFGLTPVSRKKLKGSSSTPTDEEDFLDEL